MRFFSYEIQRAFAFAHRRTFDEDIASVLGGDPSLQNYNIYAFTKSKKVRFDAEGCEVLWHDVVRVRVRCGHETAELLFVLYEHWDPLSRCFPSPEAYRAVLSKVELDKKTSTDATLHLIVWFGGDRHVDLKVHIEMFLSALDLPFGGPPEVVYIGQTFSLKKRFRTHEQLNRAATLLDDDEDLRINLLSFKLGIMGDNPGSHMWDYVLHENMPGSAQWRDKVDLLERVLIFFFRPMLNSQHVATPIEKDSVVNAILRNNGITAVVLGTGMEGLQWQFWSRDQACESEHGVVCYDFEKRERGFTAGVHQS